MAPELIHSRTNEQGYDGKQVDVWASGILLIVMLLGTFPYDHIENPDPNSSAAQEEVWCVPSCFPLPTSDALESDAVYIHARTDCYKLTMVQMSCIMIPASLCTWVTHDCYHVCREQQTRQPWDGMPHIEAAVKKVRPSEFQQFCKADKCRDLHLYGADS